MNHRDIAVLMDGIAPVLRGYVETAFAPIGARMLELEKRVEALPAPRDGKDADPVLILRLVEETVAKTPVQKIDPAEVERVVVEKVEVAVAALPAPINGKDVSPEAIKAAVLGVIAEVLPGEVSTAIEALPKPKDADAIEIANLLADLMPVPADGNSVTLDDVRPLLEELVAALPVPVDGKSVDATEVAEMVSAEVIKALEAWPRPVDGKSVTLDEVRPILEEMVAALPVPANGKDADPVEIAALIVEDVAKLIPIPADGKSVTIDDVKPMLENMVAALPKPENGKDADPAQVAALLVDDLAKLIPVPRDGKSVSVEDVLPSIEKLIEQKVADLPKPKDGVGLAGALIDRGGELVITLSDGSTKTLGVVVGKDVDPDAVSKFILEEVAKIRPKDGIDGVGFDDMDLVDVGGDLKLRFTRGDIVKDFSLPLPTYRGVWEDLEFKKGATVTWAGSLWIAERDTKAKPDTPDGGWRLAVKRGRDGASAFDVARKNGFKGSETDWLNSLRPKPAAPVKAS